MHRVLNIKNKQRNKYKFCTFEFCVVSLTTCLSVDYQACVQHVSVPAEHC